MNFKKILAGIGAFALAAGLATGLAAGLASSGQASALTVVYGVPYAYSATHSGSSNFADGKVRPTGLLYWTGTKRLVRYPLLQQLVRFQCVGVGDSARPVLLGNLRPAPDREHYAPFLPSRDSQWASVLYPDLFLPAS